MLFEFPSQTRGTPHSQLGQTGQSSQVGPLYGGSYLHVPQTHMPLPLHSFWLVAMQEVVSVLQLQVSLVHLGWHTQHPHIPLPTQSLLYKSYSIFNIIYFWQMISNIKINSFEAFLPALWSTAPVVVAWTVKVAALAVSSTVCFIGSFCVLHSQKPATHWPLPLHTGVFGPKRHKLSSRNKKESLFIWQCCPKYSS